jgi:hypothetical protein
MRERKHLEELGVDGYLKCLLKIEDGTCRLDGSDSESSVFMICKKYFENILTRCGTISSPRQTPFSLLPSCKFL